MRDLRLVFAPLALEYVLSQVGNGYEAAQIANMYSVGVRDFKKSLPQKLGGAVRNLTIWKNKEQLRYSDCEQAFLGA